MPFMLIVLGFALPLYKKAQEKKKMQQKLVMIETNQHMKNALNFGEKVTNLYFAFLIIFFTIVNSYTNISQKAHDILKGAVSF